MLQLLNDKRFLSRVTSSEQSQVVVSVLLYVFQTSTSVLSQSPCAARSTRSVSTIKVAMCASAQKATRRKTASVSKHHSQVRMKT